MATSITPLTSIPTASGDVAGSFTPGAQAIRLSVALTSPGRDSVRLLRQNGTGYWEDSGIRVDVERLAGDFVGGSASVEVQLNSLDRLHALSSTGHAAAHGAVTLENLTPTTTMSLPTVSGGTVVLDNASQSLSSKTLVSPVVSTGLTASGSASNDFSASTGTFKTSTGAVTIGGGSAAITATSSAGAITLTAGAASTWSTTAGILGIDGAGGVRLRYSGATVVDVGVTSSTAVTLGANKSLSAAAGTGALSLGSMTGDTAMPTGALSWTGASTKAASLVSTGSGASITITAGAASTWSTSAGALTLTSAAAATWSAAAGALTLSGASGLNLQYNGGTLVDVGATSSTAVTLAANIGLSGAAGTGGLALGSMTGATALPTGNLSWAGASTKTASIVSTGAAASITITAGAASTWSTSSGALTVDSAAALNLGTSAATSIVVGKAGALYSFNGVTAAAVPTPAGYATMQTVGSTNALFRDSATTGGVGATQFTFGDVVASLKTLGLLKQ